MMSPAGRPKVENPKNIRLEIRLTKEQSNVLEYCAKELSKSKTDVINLGIQKVKEELEKK